jgi:hypothetical protein
MDTTQVLAQARRERGQMVPKRPPVQTGCVCRNGGVADENGLIYVSPVCLRHGRHLPHGGGRPPSPEEKASVEAAIAARRAEAANDYARRYKHEQRKAR